jgi:hypothetical protein
MLMLFAWLVGAAAAADQCQSTRTVSEESLQVAWISRTDKQVWSNTYVEVVRTGDLRTWLSRNGTDTVRLLRGLGMVKGNKGQSAALKGWKITLFDVRRNVLCRPIEDGVPGETVGGVAICEESEQSWKWGYSKGFTGCGYIEDTQVSVRGLDVFRVRWVDAATWGFCVLPLSRFLKES